MWLWWPVLVSGFGVMSISEARGTVTLSKRISLRIHHNGNGTRQSGIFFNRL